MIDTIGLAQQAIQNRINTSNLPPWGPAAINAIMNRDSKAGQELANNLLASYGIPKDQLEPIIEQKLKQVLGIQN